MLQAMITKRFHQCLKQESQSIEKKSLYFSLPDHELVHKVCRRERLTLYNFLKFHVADQGLTDRSEFDTETLIATLNEERIKDLIH